MMIMTMNTVQRYRSWRQRRQAERQLRALSDHALQDMGLRRASIISTVSNMDGDGERRYAGY